MRRLYDLAKKGNRECKGVTEVSDHSGQEKTVTWETLGDLLIPLLFA